MAGDQLDMLEDGQVLYDGLPTHRQLGGQHGGRGLPMGGEPVEHSPPHRSANAARTSSTASRSAAID
jgi:hypothetical protein